MINVSLLEADDVIQKGDFVRYLDIEYVGQSDTVMTSSTYGGTPINFFRWLPVEEFCPFFVGKKLKKFTERMASFEKQHQPVAQYEFVRGDIPDTHKLKGCK